MSWIAKAAFIGSAWFFASGVVGSMLGRFLKDVDRRESEAWAKTYATNAEENA